MDKPSIQPEKINKPIQLLGAWLAGLFSVDSCFLFAASHMAPGSFESIALVLAAITNVPIFLVAVFLLQTRFRPELQEDAYYSTYLSQKTNEPISVKKEDARLAEVTQKLSKLEGMLSVSVESEAGKGLLDGVLFGVNTYLENRDKVIEVLKSKGVIGISSFGNGDLQMRNFAVAVSEHLPKKVQNYVVEIAKEAGATHFGYFDNLEEETEEDVLFGGYNADHFEIA